MTNKKYDAIKIGVTVGLPALAVLVTTLGNTWGWPNTEAIATTITAFAAFFSAVLVKSSYNYQNKQGDENDG